MKISKSIWPWRESCRDLFDSIVCLLTFDAIEFTENWRIEIPYDCTFKIRFRIWWRYTCDIPKALFEVLTLGYFTLR